MSHFKLVTSRHSIGGTATGRANLLFHPPTVRHSPREREEVSRHLLADAVRGILGRNDFRCYGSFQAR